MNPGIDIVNVITDHLNIVCLCLGATGPLYAGYMLAGGYSWRLFFYVESAFAGALLVLAFFYVEESMYHREIPTTTDAQFDGNSETKEIVQHQEQITTSVPKRKSFISTLRPWSHIDRDADFFGTMVRPFSYFVIPAVFWVVATYGEFILPVTPVLYTM